MLMEKHEECGCRACQGGPLSCAPPKVFQNCRCECPNTAAAHTCPGTSQAGRSELRDRSRRREAGCTHVQNKILILRRHIIFLVCRVGMASEMTNK